MLFAKKQEKEKTKLLYPENVKVGCQAASKESVIRAVGQMLVDSGYVSPPYIDAMLEREKIFSTFMGNELALPHGIEEAKKDIKASGIAVMIFPDGVDWGGDVAKVVIGIAGVGEEHLKILSIIAELALAEGNMDRIISGSAEEVYEILKGGDGG